MGRALADLNKIIDDLSFTDVRPSAQTVSPVKQPPAAEPAAPPPVPTAAKPAVAKAKAAAAPQAKNAAEKAASKASEAPAPAPAPSGDALAATESLYQTDTYLFKCEARVLAVVPIEGDKPGWSVMLDRTCFHPQGGGQPADSGTITAIDGGEPFAVSMCKKEAAGVVRHEGVTAAPAFGVGATVRCVVDESPRIKNARVHSAGHLIDVAMTESLAALQVSLRPTKGYHFTPGACECTCRHTLGTLASSASP